ncbi:MAG: hypothetical protein FJY77_02545 [Candidatus Altiarchaeales archaeon]|nr:hypothetical protein [Candidatus Altiarchaeales archaeon]
MKADGVRDFAIAVFCTLASILILLCIFLVSIILLLMFIGILETSPPSVWSECTNKSTNLYISASEDLEQVRCVALDKEFFSASEVNIGKMSEGDEDVCRFTLARETDIPLRFEIHYNGKVLKEVCDWEYYGEYLD